MMWLKREYPEQDLAINLPVPFRKIKYMQETLLYRQTNRLRELTKGLQNSKNWAQSFFRLPLKTKRDKTTGKVEEP